MRSAWSTAVAAREVRRRLRDRPRSMSLVTAPLGMAIALAVRHPGVLYWLGRQGVRIGLAAVGIRYRASPGPSTSGAIVPPCTASTTRATWSRPSSTWPFAPCTPKPAHPVQGRAPEAAGCCPVAFGIAGFVPIERRNREQSRAAIDAAAAALKAGFSFLVFPEGTRSRSGGLLPFKKGGFVMAIRGGAAVVPLTILGAGEAMRRGSPIIRPVTVSVRIRASHRVPAVRLRPARRADRGHAVGDGGTAGGRARSLRPGARRSGAAGAEGSQSAGDDW